MFSDRLLYGAAGITVLLLAAFVFTQTLPVTSPQTDTNDNGLQTFASEADFKAYIESAAASSGGDGGSEKLAHESGGAPTATADTSLSRSTSAGQQTNVQVSGVQEPDFVKTDGQHLFYSGNRWRHSFNTTILSDLPDMQLSENLSERGELLVHNDTLIVVGTEQVTAYNIGDGSAAKQWEESLEHGVKTARLVDGQLVLVLSNQINKDSLCPIRPMKGMSMPCTSIYHPGFNVPVDATYSVVKLDAATGETNGQTAFVGSPRAEVYVTGNGVYMAYTESKQRSNVMMDFLLNHASISADVKERLQTVDGYELSEQARNVEINHIMGQWQQDNPKQAKTLQKELRQYAEERKRTIDSTTIVHIGMDMQPSGEATIPGRVTDRMHLHEYNGGLAVLSRISPSHLPTNTTNDLTVLDESLAVKQQVKGIADGWLRNAQFVNDQLFLTKDEQLNVYGLNSGTVEARFEDTPEYVHAIGDNRVLAVGRVDQNVEDVKEERVNSDVIRRRIYIRNLTVSILNVAEGTVEETKVLDQPWSRVGHDIHAFQHDPATSRFFLPSHQESYVGSYSDGLTLDAVNVTGASRAFFINDHLYTISHEDIRVFDSNQDRVSTLHLPEQKHEPKHVAEPRIE